jgi:uncharacterized protein YdeI (BOF family)
MKKIAIAAAVALAASGIATSLVAFAGGAGAGEVKAPAAAIKPAAAVAQAAPLDLAQEQLTYVKHDTTVTVSKAGTVVATITLESAKYTDSSGRIEFTVDAKRPVLIDTQLFTLYDSDGGENSVSGAEAVTLTTGQHPLVLDFSDTGKPEAVGWAPSDGDAVWAR